MVLIYLIYWKKKNYKKIDSYFLLILILNITKMSTNDKILINAVKNGQLNVLKDYPIDHIKNELLMLCINNDCMKIIVYLKDNSERSNAEMDYCNIIEYLIKNGSDIHHNNDYLLRISIHNNFYNIIKLLLSEYGNELKEILSDEKLKTKLLKIIIDKNLTDNKKIIQVYRELGFDIFDMIEKEY